jgi:predicted N-acyltransferase
MGDIEKPSRETELETTRKPVVVRIASRIADVPAQEWDACSCDVATQPGNPFIIHAFLRAVEDSGSATRNTGWMPQHLLLEGDEGRLAGCMPCYLKSHSQGEYVFDHGWADAYMRAGGRDYPKLQVSVPFTPVPGPRLMLHPQADPALFDLLAKGLIDAAFQRGVSSLHVTFAREQEWRRLGELGFLQRQA